MKHWNIIGGILLVLFILFMLNLGSSSYCHCEDCERERAHQELRNDPDDY